MVGLGLGSRGTGGKWMWGDARTQGLCGGAGAGRGPASSGDRATWAAQVLGTGASADLCSAQGDTFHGLGFVEQRGSGAPALPLTWRRAAAVACRGRGRHATQHQHPPTPHECNSWRLTGIVCLCLPPPCALQLPVLQGQPGQHGVPLSALSPAAAAAAMANGPALNIPGMGFGSVGDAGGRGVGSGAVERSGRPVGGLPGLVLLLAAYWSRRHNSPPAGALRAEPARSQGHSLWRSLRGLFGAGTWGTRVAQALVGSPPAQLTD